MAKDILRVSPTGDWYISINKIHSLQVKVNGSISNVENALIGAMTDIAEGLAEQTSPEFALVYFQEIMVQVRRNILAKSTEVKTVANGEDLDDLEGVPEDATECCGGGHCDA